MCYYPRFIKNPKYLPNKKNHYMPPRIKDERVSMVPIGCGVCKECRRQRANGWMTRIEREIASLEKNVKAYYVTLTFSEESYISLAKKIQSDEDERQDNNIAKEAVKLFRERWRKKHHKSVRHWLVTELGHQGTERLHLHGYIFTEKDPNEINDIWGYGFTKIFPGNGSIKVRYIMNYVQKNDPDHSDFTQIVLTSPGIGGRDFEASGAATWAKYDGEKTRDTYRCKDGIIKGLPHYYKNKIYTDEQKEKLWIMKMERHYHYTAGIRVEAWEGKERDLELLQQAREDNRTLGYAEPRFKEKYLKECQDEQFYKRLINNNLNNFVENFSIEHFGKIKQMCIFAT